MANLIQYAKDQVSQLTDRAYQAAAAAGVLPAGVTVKGSVEIPKDPQNGDYASSFAMAGAKAMKMAPRAIAQAVADHMDLTGTIFASVEIAGPGFLNFRLGPKWYGDVLADIETEGAQYGQSQEGQGKTVMVEFVSANPTGPMHMGNARGGVLGDTLANILRRDGWDTWKEFYVNDAGNQINKFAVSIQARYLQLLLGEDAVPFPEDGYHGEDIKELAKGFYEAHGDGYRTPRGRAAGGLAAFGLKHNIPGCRRTCAGTALSMTSGSMSPLSTSPAMWPRRWPCSPRRGGPMKRTGRCGCKPPSCCGRNTWPRARAKSRWTSWT